MPIECDLICHKKCMSKSNSLTSNASSQTSFSDDAVVVLTVSSSPSIQLEAKTVVIPDAIAAVEHNAIIRDITGKNDTTMVLEHNVQRLIPSKELILCFGVYGVKKLYYYMLVSTYT